MPRSGRGPDPPAALVCSRSETVIALSMRMAGFGLTLIATAALGLISLAASATTGQATTGQATTAAPSTLKTVTYLGYAFSVPASWP
jgi:hypothetical protein